MNPVRTQLAPPHVFSPFKANTVTVAVPTAQYAVTMELACPMTLTAGIQHPVARSHYVVNGVVHLVMELHVVKYALRKTAWCAAMPTLVQHARLAKRAVGAIVVMPTPTAVEVNVVVLVKSALTTTNVATSPATAMVPAAHLGIHVRTVFVVPREPVLVDLTDVATLHKHAHWVIVAQLGAAGVKLLRNAVIKEPNA